MNDPKTVILIVDDDRMMRELATTIIERNFPSFQVETREDGQRGLEFFEQNSHKLALILTDFRMPNMNGMEFISHVREKDKEVGIVLASGNNDTELHTCGADFFLHKPYEVRALVSAVDSVLSLKGLV